MKKIKKLKNWFLGCEQGASPKGPRINPPSGLFFQIFHKSAGVRKPRLKAIWFLPKRSQKF